MDNTIFENNARSRFRLIGILEGTSYLVLLLIAMPLKYVWDLPLAVKYVGWAHGVLFIAYIVALLIATFKYRWSFWKLVLGGVASLLPFGPFVIDKRVKGW
jgi:integral membrane protein